MYDISAVLYLVLIYRLPSSDSVDGRASGCDDIDPPVVDHVVH